MTSVSTGLFELFERYRSDFDTICMSFQTLGVSFKFPLRI